LISINEFPEDQLYCVLDYETYSEANLKKVGAFEYSVHPSTEIICMAWRIGTRESLRTAKTHSWAPGEYNLDFLSAIADRDIIFVAHNALFEQVITRNVLKKHVSASFSFDLPPERWVCTASLAAALALPRSLEGAALALKLPVQKDIEGRKLMLRWCKPRKISKSNSKTRHDDYTELTRLIQYCKTDVDTEVELFLKVPPLTPTERAVWVLDQKINLRGFLVDRTLVNKTLELIDREIQENKKRVSELSGGTISSANQRDALLRWLEKEGCYLSELTKASVDDALSQGLAKGRAREMLELRRASAKTSTAKYQAFEMRSRHDSRLRDILVYHAASTGRWGGAGVQPQNFPRGSIKNTLQASDIVRSGDLELIRLIYGEPMSVFSSCLRNMIIAPIGSVFDVADYNAIEARVLFWVAKHDEGLRAFREDRDLYREQAAKVFNTTPDKIGEDSFERFIGKGLILGCGYAMGPKKFELTCRMQGREVKSSMAELAVATYRSTHAPVVKLWGALERAALAAVENLGKRYSINRTSWYVRDGFLFCELPSGRRLAYYGPEIKYEPTPWGEKKAVLYHWGVGLNRTWELQKTYGGKLTENVVQAIARDLMAEAMLRIEKTDIWKIVLSVHDELIAERSPFEASNEEFCWLMAKVPDWAEGCPVKVKGWEGQRYKK
jgi:DNA polymerase